METYSTYEKVGMTELLVTLVLFIPLIALKGFIISRLFNWFLSPYFGMEVNFVFGVGLALLSSLISGFKSEKAKTKVEFWSNYISGILYILLSWLMGYITYLILV